MLLRQQDAGTTLLLTARRRWRPKSERMSQISQSLLALIEPLTQRRASDAVADIVLEMLATN